MKFTLNKGEKGKVEIKIDITKVDFGKVYSDVLAQLSKDAQISGFRPGHAPDDVVEKYIGLGKILNETANFLISKHLAEILEKEKLQPIDSPSIAIQSLSKDSDFSFTVSLNKRPEIKIGDWKKIKVKKIKAKDITESDVNESIKNIFDAFQKQKEKAKSTNGEEDDHSDNGKYIYDASGNKLFLEKSLRSSPPKADAGLKIDDEFAKAVGARDLVHLQEIVKRDLEQIATDQIEAKFEDDLFGEITGLAEIEVPDILIDDELNRILIRFNSQLEGQGLKLDKYLEDEKTTMDDLKNKWRPQAEKNVKLTLIMDEIGKDEKISVSKEELEKALTGFDQSKMSDEQKTDLQRYVALSLFQAKTLDLIKKATSA